MYIFRGTSGYGSLGGHGPYISQSGPTYVQLGYVSIAWNLLHILGN